MPEPRILFYDIETSHNIVAKFSLREEYVNHTSILQERYIICAAWKWLGKKKIHAVAVNDFPAYRKQPHDDRQVVEKLNEVLASADVIVAHNGDRFDFPWIAGRALKHALPPLPPIPSIDTLKVARRAFSLNSNRLDYLGQYLGLGGKTNTPPGLWIDVLKGSEKAIREMVAYNKRDVELLEQVYLKLRPYAPEHFNAQLVGSGGGCPRCGSEHVHSRGWHASLTQVYRRFRCMDCGGWFRSRTADKTRTVKGRTL